MAITNLDELDLSKVYTFKDYLSWQFKERVELLRGYIAKMSPAPSSRHQVISRQIFQEINWFLKKKACQAFYAPFDVYLPRINDEKDTIVQPDICVICDTSKIKKHGCVGSPDLVIEILSPGNSRREMKDKYELYEQSGVQEYWVVFPSEQVLQIYALKDGKYFSQRPYTRGDKVISSVLVGLELDLEDVFEDSLNLED
jgi:Uma2 family endonuclease